MTQNAFKCVAFCAPFLRDDQHQHCLTGVKLHVTLALPPSLEEQHKGAWYDPISWLGGHADPVINRLGPPLHRAEPTKAQTQCILAG